MSSVVEPEERQIDAATLRAALARARKEQVGVVAVLAEVLACSPEALARRLARELHHESLDLAGMERLLPAFDLLPFPEAQARGCLALRDGPALRVVLSDPFDADLQAWCIEQLGVVDGWCIAPAADISAYLARHEDTIRAFDSAMPAGHDDGVPRVDVEDLSIRSIAEDASEVVRLVNSTIYDALKAGASDIHVESHARGLVIKYRLDGSIVQVGAVDGTALAEQVLSRLKVMSELDIAERRVPQDGRFRIKAFGREIDLRVSVMPSIHGEDAVLRVLDKQALADELAGLRLDGLGFDERTLVTFRRLSSEPYGLLLVTGPTGSGKTTTLYAAISEINHGHDKIITIEDPVEYQLPGVLQIPVNEKKGLGFARGLRSILRHDPDRIMVGEIRDPETAQIAIQAALTGHLVFSTVHANNVFDVIGRFTHMDVDPYSFVSALRGVLAQRLVRVLCSHCRDTAVLSPEVLHASGIDPDRAAAARLHTALGCGKCRGSGYKGRKAIGELLVLDDELRELIVARAPMRQIKEAARRAGTAFLRESAVAMFLAGDTSLQEIDRVTLVG